MEILSGFMKWSTDRKQGKPKLHHLEFLTRFVYPFLCYFLEPSSHFSIYKWFSLFFFLLHFITGFFYILYSVVAANSGTWTPPSSFMEVGFLFSWFKVLLWRRVLCLMKYLCVNWKIWILIFYGRRDGR